LGYGKFIIGPDPIRFHPYRRHPVGGGDVLLGGGDVLLGGVVGKQFVLAGRRVLGNLIGMSDIFFVEWKRRG